MRSNTKPLQDAHPPAQDKPGNADVTKHVAESPPQLAAQGHGIGVRRGEVDANPKQTHANEEAQGSTGDVVTWLNFWRNPSTAFDFATVALAGVMLYVAIKQLAAIRIARDALTSSQASSRDQLRAYVFAESAGVSWLEDGVDIVVAIRNSGATPATFFEVAGTADFLLPHERLPVPQGGQRAAWTALGAGSSTNAGFIVLGLKKEHLSRSLDNYLSARGVVRYGTIFGETFESEFTFMLSYRDGKDANRMRVADGKHRIFARVPD